jgi:MYXO-CTERM domain-containing protein
VHIEVQRAKHRSGENEMRGLHLSTGFLVLMVFVLCSPVESVQAVEIHPLVIFTDNGNHSDNPDVDLYVEVVDKDSFVDFKFINDSLIDCSIARIYFQGGAFLGEVEIIPGPGTSFSGYPKPHNLPGGNTLDPPFIATYELSMDSDPPVPKNGINPGEWLIVKFELINNGTFLNVVEEMHSGALRIGTHVIGFDDGSSESAVTESPEPATLSLLGLGALALLRRRRTKTM